MVTLKEVARVAKVSVATVSYVVNNKQIERIPLATRSRVLKLVRKLHYRPSALAQNLQRGKTDTIGFLYDESHTFLMHDPFCREIFCGIEQETEIAGLRLMFASRNDRKSLPHYLKDKHVDGIIYLSAKSPEIVEKLKTYRVPFILVTPDIVVSGCHSLEIDDAAGITLGMKYLIAQGYIQIHFAAAYSDRKRKEPAGFFRRAAAYEQVCRQSDFTPCIHWAELPRDKYASLVAGRELGRRLAAARTRPDAVFCANDWIALGIKERIKDIRVMGYDGIMLDGNDQPLKLTVRVPLADIGCAAVRTLNKLIAGKPVAAKTFIQPEVYECRGEVTSPRQRVRNE